MLLEADIHHNGFEFKVLISGMLTPNFEYLVVEYADCPTVYANLRDCS